MTWTVALLCVSMAGAALLLRQRLGLNLSLASVLLSFLLLFHGPAYLYYTRVYGPDTDFYDVIVSAAKGADVLPTLDTALALCFVFVCLGILFVDFATRTRLRTWRLAQARWERTPIRVDAASKRRVLLAAGGLAVALLLPFVIIDAQLPKVLDYFTADLSEVEKIALRREGGGSSFYVYNLALGNLIPFVAFALLALALSGARGVKARTIGFLALVAIGKGATLSRAPLAVFVLQCAIVWLMLRGLTLSWRVATLLGLLSAVLFMVMTWVANPRGDEFVLILEFLFYRVFMIVNESLLEYFAAIPYAIPHSWGAQVSWLAALFQQQPSLPTFLLVGEVHRGSLASTTTVMFMGDAWADFAWAGVVAVAFVTGALVRWIDVALIVRRGKSVASVAGLSLGHYGLFIAMSTSLQTAMLTGGLLFIVPFVALLSGPRRARRAAEPPGAAARSEPAHGPGVPGPLLPS